MKQTKYGGFSLMEMMVVLLIIAIVMAATAPMISKKMISATSDDSPWYWIGNQGDAGYNIGNANTTAFIGTAQSIGSGNARLQVTTSNTTTRPQIKITDQSGGMNISYNSSTCSLGITDQAISGNDSVAIGFSSQVSNGDALAVGTEAKALGSGAVAIGSGNERGGSGSSTGPNASGTNATAVGHNATAVDSGTAVGANTNSGDESVSIGSNAKAPNDGDVSVGVNTYSEEYSTALGYSANASGEHAIALGDSANASGMYSVASGNGAKAAGNYSIALGSGANVSGANTIAIGHNTTSTGEGSIAIGPNERMKVNQQFLYFNTTATNVYSAALGVGARATHNFSTAIGFNAQTTRADQIVLGTNNTTVYIPGKLIVDNSVALARNTGKVILRAYDYQARYAVKGAPKVNWNGGNDYCFSAATSGSVDFGNDETVTYSDRRLKNVGDIYKAGLDELKKLEFYHYTFKADENKTPRVGVIAQDLQKIFPDAVVKGEDGFLMIRWEDMFYAVINAVKELDSRLTALSEQVKLNITSVAKLQERVLAQEKEITELKKQNIEFAKQNAEFVKQNAEFTKRLEKLEKRK